MLTLITFMKYSFRSPRHSNHRDKKKKKKKKGKKKPPNWKRSRIIMFANDMT